MNKSIGNIRKYFIALAGLILTLSLNAQTLTQVIEAFNAGAGDMNSGNYEAALSGFESAIEQAKALGTEGDEMRAKAEAQIPNVYYRIALEKYKAKDIEGAIVSFEDAVTASNEYGNDNVKSRSLSYIPQLYNAVGNSKLQSGSYEDAIVNYDKAIEYTPDYARAYYGKAVAYMKMNDNENMVSTMEKAMQSGNATSDTTTAQAAAKILSDHFIYEGKVSYKAENYADALADFETSLKYDSDNAEPYYLMCVIHGKNKEFEEAVDYGLKALDYEEDNVNKKAPIYYELGMAYIALVEYDKACDALGRAMVEPYTETVKHNMEEVLKCNQ